MDLSKLPSPFYRGTIKAIILDEHQQLLVGAGEESNTGWEIPGGGLEHDETIEDCLKREIMEELGVEVEKIGQVAFIYRGKSVHGWMILRVAMPVELKSTDFKFGDMKAAKFVTRDEFLSLDFAADEGTIKTCVDFIWPPT
jgi:ADP-ribose pyrophosphatase YjhB (NUDIX family)